MITVYLRVYRPQNFREKKVSMIIALAGTTGDRQLSRGCPRAPCVVLNLTTLDHEQRTRRALNRAVSSDLEYRTEVAVDEIRSVLEGTRNLRLALDALGGQLPDIETDAI